MQLLEKLKNFHTPQELHLNHQSISIGNQTKTSLWERLHEHELYQINVFSH